MLIGSILALQNICGAEVRIEEAKTPRQNDSSITSVARGTELRRRDRDSFVTFHHYADRDSSVQHGANEWEYSL